MAGLQAPLHKLAQHCGLDSCPELTPPQFDNSPVPQGWPEKHLALDRVLAVYEQLSQYITQEVPAKGIQHTSSHIHLVAHSKGVSASHATPIC